MGVVVAAPVVPGDGDAASGVGVTIGVTAAVGVAAGVTTGAIVTRGVGEGVVVGWGARHPTSASNRHTMITAIHVFDLKTFASF